MNFGEYIKTNRDARNLTQQELAEMIGVSNTTISNYETGTSTPSFRCMLKLFSVLGTPFYGDENNHFRFCKYLCEAFSKSELKGCTETLFAVQAGSKLCCSDIFPDDFIFVGPFSKTPGTGERIFFKSGAQHGIYKLYPRDNAYILIPESPHSLAPICVNSLKNNVYEIKAVLHITAQD